MPQEPVTESASRLGRFAKSTSDTQKKGGNMVTNIQAFAKSENERKRKEEEEKKRKAAQPVNTEPQKGFIQRMIDKYYYGKE